MQLQYDHSHFIPSCDLTTFQCPRLMLLLRGDPSNCTGVYKLGTEYLVTRTLQEGDMVDNNFELDYQSFLPSVASMKREFRQNW